MVKGISRQVIVVQSPDPKLFEQAIFILKEDAVGNNGVTEESLLREANRLINRPRKKTKGYRAIIGGVWAAAGALVTAAAWILSSVW